MGVGSKTKFKLSNLFSSHSSNNSSQSSNPGSLPQSPLSASNSSSKSNHNLAYHNITNSSNSKNASSQKSFDQFRSDNSRLKHSPSSNTLASSNYNTTQSVESRRKNSISSSRPIFKVFGSKQRQDANSSNTNLSLHSPQTPSSLSSPSYDHRMYDPDEAIRKSFAEHRNELDELHAGMVELETQLDGIRLDTIDSISPPTPPSSQSAKLAPSPNLTLSPNPSMDSHQLFQRIQKLESELNKERNDARLEFEAKVEALSQLKVKEKSEIELQRKLNEAVKRITSLEEENAKHQETVFKMQKNHQREISSLKSQNNTAGDEKVSYQKLQDAHNSLSTKFHNTKDQLIDSQTNLESAGQEIQSLQQQIKDLLTNEIQLKDQLQTYELTSKAHQLAQSRSNPNHSGEVETLKAERDDLIMKYNKAQEHIQALKFSLESVIQTNISSPPVSTMDSPYMASPHSNGYSSVPRNMGQRQNSYPTSNTYFNNPNSFNAYSSEHDQPTTHYSNPHHSYSQSSNLSPTLANHDPSSYYQDHHQHLSQSTKTKQSNKLKYPSGHPRRQTFGDQTSPTHGELNLPDDVQENCEPDDLDSTLRSLIQDKEKMESEYSRIPISKISLAARKRKDELEENLNRIDAEISRVKTKIRART